VKIIAAAFCSVLALLVAASAGAQAATAAAVTREQKPVYPEGLAKSNRQGNVMLIGRLDKAGKLQDIQAIAATNIGFVDPAIAAVKNWVFKPATRAGKPIETAANVVLRFRLEGDRRGQIPRAALGDIAVYPANAAGAKSLPDGFPIRRGGDPRVRVEAILDVPPQPKARKLGVRGEAISPAGRPSSSRTTSRPSRLRSRARPQRASRPRSPPQSPRPGNPRERGRAWARPRAFPRRPCGSGPRAGRTRIGTASSIRPGPAADSTRSR